jgi:hypothetical protein
LVPQLLDIERDGIHILRSDLHHRIHVGVVIRSRRFFPNRFR